MFTDFTTEVIVEPYGYENFGEYFRKVLMTKLISRVDPALEHLHRTDEEQ